MDICIFGDSITWGAHDVEKGGWAERLKVYLREKYRANIYNLGIPGDTTGDLVARMKPECVAREPKLIVVAIGINDSQYAMSDGRKQIVLDTFRENLAAIHGTAKQFTPEVIFIGLTRVDESKTKPIPWSKTGKCYENESIEKYDAAIQDYCEEHGLPYISMKDAVGSADLYDGLHPNSAGHARMFERIKAEVEKKITL